MRRLSFSLRGSVHSLEDAIITLSGPGIAVSGVIAGVDLLTGGHAMQGLPWLSTAWAICLLLSLDFQILSLGARAHQVYLSDKSLMRKVIEVGLATIIAAGIGYVSIQMQSIVSQMNAAGVTIDQAAAVLGINERWLIWERSGLVIALIFLSGWFSLEHGMNHPVNHQVVQSASATSSPVVVQGFKGSLNQAKQMNHLLHQQRQIQRLTGHDVQVVQLNQASLDKLSDAMDWQCTSLAAKVNGQIDEILELASANQLGYQQLIECLEQPSRKLEAVFSRVEKVLISEERTGTGSAIGSAIPRQARALSAPTATAVQELASDELVDQGQTTTLNQAVTSTTSSMGTPQKRVLDYLDQCKVAGIEPSLAHIEEACGVAHGTAVRQRAEWKKQRAVVQ